MRIYFNKQMIKHKQTEKHPDSPARIIKLVERLQKEGLYNDVKSVKLMNQKYLENVHSKQHIDRIKSGVGQLDNDTHVKKETFNLALHAMSCSVASARYSFKYKKPSLAIVRPGGHHAHKNGSGGFCYFNNDALAAFAVDRPAIIDIDVHHGDGTATICHDNPNVFYASSHQRTAWPGTGPSSDRGAHNNKLNVPLESGSGDKTFRNVYYNMIFPEIRKFKPKILIVSLGVDSHYMDPLANLTLSSAGYVEILFEMKKLADEICEGRIAYILGGGYNVEVLSEVVTGLVGKIEGKDVELKYNDIIDSEKPVIISKENLTDEHQTWCKKCDNARFHTGENNVVFNFCTYRDNCKPPIKKSKLAPSEFENVDLELG